MRNSEGLRVLADLKRPLDEAGCVRAYERAGINLPSHTFRQVEAAAAGVLATVATGEGLPGYSNCTDVIFTGVCREFRLGAASSSSSVLARVRHAVGIDSSNRSALTFDIWLTSEEGWQQTIVGLPDIGGNSWHVEIQPRSEPGLEAFGLSWTAGRNFSTPAGTTDDEYGDSSAYVSWKNSSISFTGTLESDFEENISPVAHLSTEFGLSGRGQLVVDNSTGHWNFSFWGDKPQGLVFAANVPGVQLASGSENVLATAPSAKVDNYSLPLPTLESANRTAANLLAIHEEVSLGTLDGVNVSFYRSDFSDAQARDFTISLKLQGKQHWTFGMVEANHSWFLFPTTLPIGTVALVSPELENSGYGYLHFTNSEFNFRKNSSLDLSRRPLEGILINNIGRRNPLLGSHAAVSLSLNDPSFLDFGTWDLLIGSTAGFWVIELRQRTNESAGTEPLVIFQSVPKPPHRHSLAVGLGVGLGIGLPITAFFIASVAWWMKQRQYIRQQDMENS